jgi:hypothetical protein
MFHDWSTHPINLRITTNGLVEGIDHNDLKVFVGGILANPVRVEDTESFKTTSNTFLGDGLQVPDWLHLLYGTGSLGLAEGTTLGDGTFTATTTHSNAINDEALLALVPETTGLVGTGRPGDTMDLGQLTVLPATDTKQVAHDIARLLPVQLGHVLVRAHLEVFLTICNLGLYLYFIVQKLHKGFVHRK